MWALACYSCKQSGNIEAIVSVITNIQSNVTKPLMALHPAPKWNLNLVIIPFPEVAYWSEENSWDQQSVCDKDQMVYSLFEDCLQQNIDTRKGTVDDEHHHKGFPLAKTLDLGIHEARWLRNEPILARENPPLSHSLCIHIPVSWPGNIS